MRFKTLRLVRTERARQMRRLTGTNGFRDKKLIFEESSVMPTICTIQTIENCIAVYDERVHND